MTIIIALKDKENKRIILGSDKQVTKGQMILQTESKFFSLPVNIVDGYNSVIETAKMHFAFAGATYLKSFLKYGFNIPDMPSNMNFIEYLYKKLFPAIHDKLTDTQLVEIDNGELFANMSLICIYKGKIYNIQYNLGVNVVDEDYWIDGSGCQVATGSLYTNLKYHPKLSKVEMVKQAINCAGENTIYCNDDVEIKVINYA